MVNFVDHASRLAFVYFLRSKNEVTQKLKQYLSDMERLGVKVQNIQTNRAASTSNKKVSRLCTQVEGSMSLFSTANQKEFII